ncbi:hypothetical protein P9112_003871 [Eukaryota sp. TZLM1-RC]
MDDDELLNILHSQTIVLNGQYRLPEDLVINPLPPPNSPVSSSHDLSLSLSSTSEEEQDPSPTHNSEPQQLHPPQHSLPPLPPMQSNQDPSLNTNIAPITCHSNSVKDLSGDVNSSCHSFSNHFSNQTTSPCNVSTQTPGAELQTEATLLSEVSTELSDLALYLEEKEQMLLEREEELDRRDMFSTFKTQTKEVKKERDRLRDTVGELSRRNSQLKSTVQILRDENSALSRKVRKLVAQNERLSSEVARLRL